ncbi:MAG: UDP-N-acetylmuramate dehydrogenase [Opitutales bacterium]
MSMRDAAGKYLFLGAGGMGMAPLAGWMAQAGYPVSGYDDYLREPVRRYLESAGVVLCDLLIPERLDQYTTVVYSSAVAEDHCLLSAARERGLRVLRRGAMLAEVAESKRLIAVAGSHGKTTTGGMIAHAIERSSLPVDYILGGFFNDMNRAPSRCCDGEWLVAEVDESDGTIDHFHPEVTLLLNVDWDHPDRYGDSGKIEAAFNGLLRRTRQMVLLPAAQVSPGLLDGVETRREIHSPVEGELGDLPPGRFNQRNAAAAAAVLAHLPGGPPPEVLADFGGMARRQTVLIESESLTVIEDYAHHPNEIEALLESLRTKYPDRRQAVVFQPHRYSRTRAFKDAFAAALSGADELYLLPVYAAHESPREGGRTEDLAAAFAAPPRCLSLDLSGLAPLTRLAAAGRPVVLSFVGAGDVGELAGVFAALVGSGDADRAFLDYLRSRLSPDSTLRREEPLANKTTLRVGGAARFYAEPRCLSDLRALLEAAKLFGLRHFVLGRGSNLLVPDEGFDGLVIRLHGGSWGHVEALGEDRLWAGAGVRLKEICGQAAKAGLSGFEFLEGIPGSVGGALRMNAGAMGSWMFDLVERVLYLDERGRLRDAPKSDFHFGYRKVEEISRGIALGAVLRSPDRGEERSIRERMDSYASARKESQPRAPSAGCVFKNPEGSYAGKLIDEAGLKGLSVGAAEVSTVHGNFIVNKGGATAGEVLELIRRVRARVRADSGYDLEPEVLLLGRSWEDVLEEKAHAHD